ncbi:MAG: hypothetical protein H6695_14090 [Deferribacteres bacterium]|nr:hypothetical protein [candidate division KSB1 bacterium]MCB9511318.1 hypothetical protein [Deferribacteres bacterium]
MRGHFIKILVFALVAAAPAVAQELTLDEVIQKNIDARGGAENWAKVQNMKITGKYRSFSETSPFTVWRKRPDLYRFDLSMLVWDGTICYNGEQYWWIFPRAGEQFSEPSITPEPHSHFTLREKRFEPVFWNYKEKGNTVELLGQADVDGDPHYKLRVFFPDSTEEFWYLNAETFLETKQEGPMHDFDYQQYMPMEAFYSDYREVNGIVLPFLIEQEYAIRYRIIKVENVEINTDLPDDLFVMPKSQSDGAKSP